MDHTLPPTDSRALVLRHVAWPALPTLLLLALYATPVRMFGCAPRGWMGLVVVLGAALCAFVTIFLGARCRRSGDPRAAWWMLSTLLLVTPALILCIYR